ncbi:MAG: Serratia phage Parlo [Pseudomonadota bacterium]|jgi:hypothetical protein
MTWAVEHQCKSAGQKLVLMMLANHCNGHTGQCNPSHKRLAAECCMGVSTLKGHLQGLAESGLIRVIHRRHDGVDLPNQYELALENRGRNLSPWGQNLAGEGSESGRGEGSESGYKPGSSLNQEGEPISPTDVGEKARKRATVPDRPESVPEQTWHDFLTHRKANRAPLTETALKGIAAEAEKAGLSLADALATCCQRGWRGFRAEWMRETTPGKAASAAPEWVQERDRARHTADLLCNVSRLRKGGPPKPSFDFIDMDSQDDDSGT